MARHGKNQKEYLAAEMLLKGSGLNMLDAASLAVELLSLCGGSRSMRRARKAIFLGAEELRKGERTVSFSAAVEEMLKAKRNLRPTTLRDIRYFTGALMRRCPELKGFPVRKLTPEHCAHFLEAAFYIPQAALQGPGGDERRFVLSAARMVRGKSCRPCGLSFVS